MKTLKAISFICFAFVISIELAAVGAHPEPTIVTQPDGSNLTIKLKGDEWVNWKTTIDDYRIVKNKNGIYEYATQLKSGSSAVIPSGIKARDPKKRSKTDLTFLRKSPPNLGISKESIKDQKEAIYQSARLKSGMATLDFPSSGIQRHLMILANFSDRANTYSQEDFYNLMNAGNNSFRAYYLENSDNALDISTTVTVWVTLPNTHDYYGPRNKWQQFAYDAIAAADPYVDFSDFDLNFDGIVDGITIIHQGAGQEITKDETDIWSHQFYIPSSYNRMFDGVQVNKYTAQPEMRSQSGTINTIGVICHEFGHLLGLPDFYDTNGDSGGHYDGTGNWDCMSTGVYNGQNPGSFPAHHNAWSKQMLGWCTFEEISAIQNVNIQPIIKAQKAFLVRAASPDEYFLLENRQKLGFDQGLPGHGLIIYHVDEEYINSNIHFNNINTGEHQGFYPKAAGGVINSASCPFPGSGDFKNFTDETSPNMLDWAGNFTHKSITEIKENENGTISFDFMALQGGSPTNLKAEATGGSEIRLEWNPPQLGYPVIIAYSEDGNFGTPINGTADSRGQQLPGGGTILYNGKASEFYHDELNPNTTYYYKVWGDQGDDFSYGVSLSCSTFAPDVEEFPWHEGFESGLNNWTQKSITGSDVQWTNGTGGYYSKPNNAFDGDSNALLYLASTVAGVQMLMSPIFKVDAGTDLKLKFWHAQSKWDNDQDELQVKYRTMPHGDWQLLNEYKSDIQNWQKVVLSILNVAGPIQIAFEGYAKYGYGVVVDNVELYLDQECNQPSTSVSNLAIGDITPSSIQLKWNRGDGDKVLIVAKEEGEPLNEPQNGYEYVANPNWGAGNSIGNAEYVVYNLDGISTSVNGLKSGTNYYFDVYEYNSLNNCYQLLPEKISAQTDFPPVDININVQFEGKPIGGAKVNFMGEELSTNLQGACKFTIQEGMDQKQVFFVEHPLYESYYGKIIPMTTQFLTVDMVAFDVIEPTGLKVSKEYQNISISWNPVINENFDSYEPFSLANDNWLFVDRDFAATYNLSEVSFPNEEYVGAFIVYSPYESSQTQVSEMFDNIYGNQYLMSVSAFGRANDDWLISPEIKIEDGDLLSFTAKSISNLYGLERLRVLVSKEGLSDIENFEMISETPYIEVPVDWTDYEFDLSKYKDSTIRFALNVVSDDAHAFLLDRIQVKKDVTYGSVEYGAGEINGGPIQYEVFKNGESWKKLNGMNRTTINDAVQECSLFEYKVRTNYPGRNLTSVKSEPLQIYSCYTVTIEVVIGDTPIGGAEVTIGDESRFTDKKGIAVFEGIVEGINYTYQVQVSGFDTITNVLNIQDDQQLIVDMDVSTKMEVEDLNRLIISPNPSSGIFILQFDLNINIDKIDVVNATGNLVRSYSKVSCLKPFKVDLSGLASGIYLLRIEYEDTVIVKKLYKE